ncbi:MAG: DUF983 domain-containing protein [Phenylobacterium sp.]|uniref:DUF983 domain-containing protein n=1 Tax=Phenylobacterium sp. TaxID=1871053 RepID=UPI00272689BD|nr:DUF983 domain-containing protein [Phenylobacterium sp.]MDO8901151.1 DUF983 domain-containing protein [Phenylobacterium sp.]MDP2212886.1 DUF983 domain-containing protein [Phenylobacterium sp.]
MTHSKPPSSLSAGLRCRCPNCGQGKLFNGYLTLAEGCDQCGLDYGFADPADGPAFFVMSGVGVVVTTLWAIWAVMAQPPIWAQLAVAFPAMIGGCLGSLRPVKAWLVAEQFVHKAGDAEFVSLGRHGEGGFVRDRRKASGG